MPKQTRPVMFTDWRRLFHGECVDLGFELLYLFDGRRIKMDRWLWKKLHRLNRIKARLDLECEVRDESWCLALMKMVNDWSDDNDAKTS